MEDWVTELQRGEPDAAWDRFLDRYRRLIFAAIRHYAQDYDDVMDVFARVCEALREDDLRRLRAYVAEPDHRARFSTWLVTVVRHVTVDWFRARDGRRRLSAAAESLPGVQRRIFEHVFLDHRSHLEAYELIRTSLAPALSFREFQSELRATYRAVTLGRQGHLLRELGMEPTHEEDEDQTPAIEAATTRTVLTQALDCLGAEDRLALQLYVVDGLSAEAVAKIVALPNAKAVYNRVYRALAVVRERLAQSGLGREDL